MDNFSAEQTQGVSFGQKSYKSEQINKRKMNLIQEYNKRYEFFRDITGEAMRVHRKFHGGLLESAYEAALKFLLEQKGYTVERQKFLPIYWDDVRLDQDYRMDLVVNGNIIIELKAINHIDTPHRRQLWNYMNLWQYRQDKIIVRCGRIVCQIWKDLRDFSRSDSKPPRISGIRGHFAAR